MELLVKKLKDNAIVPLRATDGSAGYDLSACIDEPMDIQPGEIKKIPIGISVEAKDCGNCVLLIYARSSLATKHGITLPNCVGVVDSDYRGEIIVPLINLSDKHYTVAPAERVAQLVVTPVLLPEVREASELSQTVRGEGGFGSTGTASLSHST